MLFAAHLYHLCYNITKFSLKMLIYVDKSIFSCEKKDLGTLVGRISSISLDLSSNFFTTNKACKEILIEEQI